MGAFEISGNDWLGIGSTGNAAYQGTDMCGSRPNCISLWSDDCKKRKNDFAACVKKTNEYKIANGARDARLKATQLQLQAALQSEKQKAASRQKIITIVIIAGIIALGFWWFFKK